MLGSEITGHSNKDKGMIQEGGSKAELGLVPGL